MQCREAYPLGGVVLVLLRLLDAVPVSLAALVARRVVLGLGHGERRQGTRSATRELSDSTAADGYHSPTRRAVIT